jgi:hypothetical protein
MYNERQGAPCTRPLPRRPDVECSSILDQGWDEAIEWAENNTDVELDKDRSGPHSDRVYVLYAKAPQPYGGKDWFVQLAAELSILRAVPAKSARLAEMPPAGIEPAHAV